MTNKIEITYTETLKYRKTFTVETDLDEDEVLSLLERHDSTDSVEDLATVLDHREGLKVVYPDSDYSSPHEVGIEYWDHTIKTSQE